MASIRQKTAILKISENIRNKKQEPIGKILRDSGFSPSIANSPSNVTNTKSWKELMDEYIPEHKILSRLGTILEKGKEENSTKAIDIATKIRGRYAPSKIELTSPEDEMNDEELDAYIKKLEEQAKKRLEVKDDSTNTS